jgi:uncharacterized protein YcnI
MMKKTLSILSICILFILCTNVASAHVTVKPSEVGVGEQLNFVVSVATEEDIPTVGVRLVVPEGLENVRQNVKPGCVITLLYEDLGSGKRVSDIVWSNGTIPPDQRDEFVFSAKAPAEEGELVWKAYQTYRDGDVVSWDASPEVIADYEKQEIAEADDHAGPKPYSTTEVVNDLIQENAATAMQQEQMKELKNTRRALLISAIAIFVAGVSLWMQFSKKQK